MYKACIFDLDGTLLNTLPTIAYYSNKALKKFGFHEITTAQFQSICRLSFKDYYETLLLYGGCPQEDVEKFRDDIGHYDREIYIKDSLYLTEPFIGIPQIIENLKKKDIKLAILTNKPDQLAQSIVAATFGNVFDLCIGYTGLNFSKPDPRSLCNLIDQLSLPKEQCLYVGDTDIDIITANSAEVFSIAVTWGYQAVETLKAYNPCAIVSSPKEILSYFE